MSFRFLFGLIFAVCLWAGHAHAVPDQVVTGYMTTSGCPSVALTPCFVQYGAGGGASTVTIGAPLGVQTAAASVAVVCNSGCSGGPADESTFTPGTTATVTGGFFQTTATNNALTNLQSGSVQMTANRAFFTNLRTAAGVETGIAAAPLQVSLANTAANATPVSSNITQFGSSNVATGTGLGGSGIPRVTVSSDSSLTSLSSSAITNPTSTLTMTSATTAYTAGQLIASNATAGSVVVPSFAIANSAGGAILPRLRLSVNDATGTAWGAAGIQVDLWSAAPTWTNGDRAAWSPATGAATHLGAYTCTMSAEFGDGAFTECSPTVGNAAMPKLASGTSVFWSLKATTGSGVTGASKVWTLTAEELN